MYVVAPALPAPYKWLNVPLNALQSEQWPGYLPSWYGSLGMESFYTTVPTSMRESLRRQVLLRNTPRWTMALLATATVVTSAMALYYYALSNDYDISLNQLLTLLNAHELSWTNSMAYGHEDDSGDDDDDAFDDDETIDADIMDGFEVDLKQGKVNVILVSSDTSSSLYDNPIHLDLRDGRTTRIPSATSSPSASRRSSIIRHECQSFPTKLLCDPRTLDELPRHRQRMARHSVSSPWGYLTPTPAALQGLDLATGEPVGKDEVVLMKELEQTPSPMSKRKVMISEPNWVHFADASDRARQRALFAMLARSGRSDGSPNSKTPLNPMVEEMARDLLMRTLPNVPPEDMGDGKEFWFERFTRSTAASSPRRDLRRGRHELAKSIDSEAFDALLSSVQQTLVSEQESRASVPVKWSLPVTSSKRKLNEHLSDDSDDVFGSAKLEHASHSQHIHFEPSVSPRSSISHADAQTCGIRRKKSVQERH